MADKASKCCSKHTCYAICFFVKPLWYLDILSSKYWDIYFLTHLSKAFDMINRLIVCWQVDNYLPIINCLFYTVGSNSNIMQRRNIFRHRSQLHSNTVVCCGVKIHEKTSDNECNICDRNLSAKI